MKSFVETFAWAKQKNMCGSGYSLKKIKVGRQLFFLNFFFSECIYLLLTVKKIRPGRVAQSVGHLTCMSEVLGSIPGLATYFRFFFRSFKRGSCQLLAKVCA